MLNKFGIKAFVNEEKNQNEEVHFSTIVNLMDNINVLLDAQADLHAIQTKLPLRNFCNSIEHGCKKLQEEHVRKYLVNLGYVKSEADFKDKAIDEVRAKIKAKGEQKGLLTPEEKLKVAITDKKINEGTSDMEYVERYKYFKYIVEEVMGVNSKFVNAISCAREENDDTEYKNCLVMKRNEYCNMSIFMYSKKAGSFVPVSIEELYNMKQDGLKIGVRQNEKGLKVLNRELKKYEQSMEKKEDERIE